MGDAAPPDAGFACGDGLPVAGELCFGEPVIIPVASAEQVVVGDFNGDDVIDLVVKGASGPSLGDQEVVLLSGIGNGTFGAPLRTPVPLADSIVAADFDRDGVSDVLVARYGETGMAHDFALYTGSRDGLVPDRPIAATGAGDPGPMTVGFFNDDKLPDVILASDNVPPGRLTLLFNDGAGVFRQSSTPSVDGTATSIMAVDLDEDGFDDIVGGTVASQVSAFLYIMMNGEDIGFRPPFDSPGVSCPGEVTATCKMASVAAGDLNDDGYVDIIAGVGGTPAGIGVQVFLGTARRGQFAAPTDYPNDSASIVDLEVVDIDRDGLTDVLAITENGTIDIYRGTGDGLLEFATSISHGMYLGPIVTADLNDDGLPDLVNANYSFGISVALSNP